MGDSAKEKLEYLKKQYIDFLVEYDETITRADELRVTITAIRNRMWSLEDEIKRRGHR